MLGNKTYIRLLIDIVNHFPPRSIGRAEVCPMRKDNQSVLQICSLTWHFVHCLWISISPLWMKHNRVHFPPFGR